ncbi:MAG: hypothetical protein FWG44_07685 [Oscillospiraceae bacterium]|nr:hypothetical protein [Oscillospiraceae bacterium]
MQDKDLFRYVDNTELNEKMKSGLINAQPRVTETKYSHRMNFAVLGGVAAVICAAFTGSYIFLFNGEISPLSEGNSVPDDEQNSEASYEISDTYPTLEITIVESENPPDYPPDATTVTYIDGEPVVIKEEPPVSKETPEPEFVNSVRTSLSPEEFEYYIEILNTRAELVRDNPLGLEIVSSAYSQLSRKCSNLTSFVYNWKYILDGEEWADESLAIPVDVWAEEEAALLKLIYEFEHPRVEKVENDSELLFLTEVSGYIYYTIGEAENNIQWLIAVADSGTQYKLIKMIKEDDEWSIGDVNTFGGEFGLFQNENGDWSYARG